MRSNFPVLLAGLSLFVAAAPGQAPAPLPSWNDTPARNAIITFVDKVTKEGSPDFVPVAERIATFDNDGTLWAEKPMYVQLAFIFDRVKALAPKHPEWNAKEPFASVLKGDFLKALASGEKGLVEIMAATQVGMSTDEFSKMVADWIATARNPDTGRPYLQMVYRPMIELLDYLRANGFKTFIVSGGGADFIRPWAEKTYGIPPEQVASSTIKTRYEYRSGNPVIIRLPEIGLVTDKAGKPEGIERLIGRHPIAAFGNSDGDLEMLEWATAGPGARLGLIVHHDDAKREWAYDRSSDIGRLDKALDAARARGWTVVSMKDDWNCIFAWEKRESLFPSDDAIPRIPTRVGAQR